MVLDLGTLENQEARRELTDYSAFDPKKYIAEYYSGLGPENAFLLEFHHRVYQRLKPGGRLLEFGGGPSIYQILSASRTMREIVFAEYLECNRREIVSWLFSGPEAADWGPYLDYVLRLEQCDPTDDNRKQLRDRVSSRLTQIIECDATLPNVLSPRTFPPFDAISSNFCLECITGREDLFVDFLAKLKRLIRPGGALVLTLLKNAESYRVGELYFPAVRVDETSIERLLQALGFYAIEVSSTPAEANQGYAGVIAVSAMTE